MNSARTIIDRALAAATVADATRVQELIRKDFGAGHQRPVGDRWNNHGMMGTAGSFDLKLIEPITNMQDAVLERLALAKYGQATSVPFATPREAGEALLPDVPEADRLRLATVELRESDHPTGTTRRLTAVFRDAGCGLTAAQVPRTIFALGSGHKEGLLWLQGAFGMGGATTYRNAHAVVLVTRRDPALLGPDEQDRITVAVVQWVEHTKGTSAYYLVDGPWQEAGDHFRPWSAPASGAPDFTVGTHLALVSYGVEGYHRAREGDERSFDTVVNTRLYDPVLPVQFTNTITRADRRTNLRGLKRRLDDNPDPQRSFGSEVLPFAAAGGTHQLPISFHLFARQGDPRERRKFVAKGHALVFTSNGQVHHHWSPQEFKNRTKLNKLADRILVVVETDELPIKLRTSFFTSDRSHLIRNRNAIRLEQEVEGFLNSWDQLTQENSRLIRESLRSDDSHPTIGIARKIARALTISGFSATGAAGGNAGGPGGAGGGGGGGGKSKLIPLHEDPTKLEGPATARGVIGRTRFLTYIVDAVDEFFDGRGRLEVTCDHELLGDREITVGKGHGGRVRVSVAVPEGAEPGMHTLRATLPDWLRSSGGLGRELPAVETKLELVDEIAPTGTGKGKPKGGANGSDGPTEGNLVAVLWSNPEKQEGWHAATVGEVTETAAALLAEARDEYAELAPLGDQAIPTITLNEDYSPLKTYLNTRSKSLVDLSRPRDEYATGVGVALLLLRQEADAMRKKGGGLASDAEQAAMRAAARAVLSVMPSFDALAKEVGLDD